MKSRIFLDTITTMGLGAIESIIGTGQQGIEGDIVLDHGQANANGHPDYINIANLKFVWWQQFVGVGRRSPKLLRGKHPTASPQILHHLNAP